jgi:6-phosphogluconolactonase
MNTMCSRSAVRVCLPMMMALGLTGCGGSSQNSISPPPPAKAEFLYATGQNQIFSFTVDPSTGALGAATATPGPDTGILPGATIAADPAAKFLFACDEQGHAVDVFSINASTGSLTASGSPFPAEGLFPSGLAIDSTGNYLYVADVSAVGAFKVSRATGTLSTVTGSPFANSGVEYGLVAAPSTGFLYAANPGIPQATISGFVIDPSSGILTPVPGSPFTTVIGGTLNVAIHPSGKFFYASGGSVDNIEGWVIDTANGALATAISGSPFTLSGIGGDISSLVIDPAGKFLYASTSGGIFGFAIDDNNGALTPITGSPFSVFGFGHLVIDPSGQFMYLGFGLFITGMNIDSSTGMLTALSGSPFATGAPLDVFPTLAIVKAP